MKLKVAHIAPIEAEAAEIKKLPLYKDPKYLSDLRLRFLELHNKQVNRKARVAAQANH